MTSKDWIILMILLQTLTLKPLLSEATKKSNAVSSHHVHGKHTLKTAYFVHEAASERRSEETERKCRRRNYHNNCRYPDTTFDLSL